jgi:putative polyhydroxyalkanoate system protein
MADVTVEQPHDGDQARARSSAERVLARMAEKMGVRAHWEGDTAHLSGGMGLKSGTVRVGPASIQIEITLALMAKPMKGMVEEMVRRSLAKALA